MIVNKLKGQCHEKSGGSFLPLVETTSLMRYYKAADTTLLCVLLFKKKKAVSRNSDSEGSISVRVLLWLTI